MCCRYGCRADVALALREYSAIADSAGLSLVELAVRFALGAQLVTSAVVGASSAEQMTQLIKAASRGALPVEIVDAIDCIHRRYPSPCP